MVPDRASTAQNTLVRPGRWSTWGEVVASMITGFNHNIKYKNRIYHVQTEDSGLKNPHIITHLFVGGNIIATKKADYSHLVAGTAPDKLPDAIRNMMEEQHKTMLRSLIHGKFDNALNVENAHHLDGPAPLNVSAEVLAQTGGSGNKAAARPAPAPAAVAQAPRPVAPQAVPAAVAQRPAPAPLDLAAAAASILGGSPTPAPAAARAAPTAMPAPVALPAESALAPEVLAARALKEKPAEKPVNQADTIFGEDLISEKSLDEVILSYLADELE